MTLRSWGRLNPQAVPIQVCCDQAAAMKAEEAKESKAIKDGLLPHPRHQALGLVALHHLADCLQQCEIEAVHMFKGFMAEAVGVRSAWPSGGISPRRPRSILGQPTASPKPYVLLCPMCQKEFRRESMRDTSLNAHQSTWGAKFGPPRLLEVAQEDDYRSAPHLKTLMHNRAGVQ